MRLLLAGEYTFLANCRARAWWRAMSLHSKTSGKMRSKMKVFPPLVG